MTAPPPNSPSKLTQADDADLFDYALLRDYGRYVRGSVRRHRTLFISIVVAIIAVTVTLAKTMPRAYRTETRLLAQRNQVIAALGNPGRTIPYDADAPTRGAMDMVMKRSNLVELIKQTNLIEHWQQHRAPLLRLKDGIFSLFLPPLDHQMWEDALVGTLEKKLFVDAGEGSVTIGIEWPDANMAYRLVEAAQQNFLEARQVEELDTINEAISILESRATSLQEEVEEAFAEMEKVRAKKPISPTPRPAQEAPKAGPKINDAEVNQLRFLVEAKRRAISDLEEFRNRRLTELQSQLAEQRVIYSAAHPTILDTEQRIQAFSKESPQITALKRDEEALSNQLSTLVGKSAPGDKKPRTSLSAMDILLVGDRSEDPVVSFAQDKLRIANAKYQDMLLRIDSARLELEASRAAFKYRYSVARPAQVPRNASKPNIPVILVGGFVAAFMVALLTCLARDLTSGKVVEPWQVTRQLGLTVLAQLGKGEQWARGLESETK